MTEKTKDFFEAIDKHGNFKFWVCPNMCRDFVDWDGDKATCRKCGTDNKSLQTDSEGRCSKIDLGRPPLMEYYQYPEGKPRRP